MSINEDSTVTKREVQKKVTEEDNAPKNSNSKENDRVTKLLSSVGKSNVGELMKKLEPVLNVATKSFETALPYIILAYNYFRKVYDQLPMDILMALFGLALVFFGGSYAVVLAAVEAFYATGYEKCKDSINYLVDEFTVLWKKSREDDKADKDGDGVADVYQITVSQLVMRKMAFFFQNCKEPQKMLDMVEGILSGFASVIAVLKLEFAKVIALGASIGNQLRKPACYLLVPVLSTALPKEYHQWILPLINVICKFIAISIAWFIQRIISSVQSAIRGGLLFSRKILNYLNEKKYITFKDEDSYLDEILGWSIAALGVFLQISYGFRVPFPINIILFPVSVLENILVWVISK